MNLPLLQVNKLSFASENGFSLRNISFKQQSGQKIAVAGETGSGKSTLLKIIAGLLQLQAGVVLINGSAVKGPAETLVPGHLQIAYLPQYFELPKFLRVEQVLDYANKLTSKDAQRLFHVCRIEKLLKRKTNELSGGERQRVALCRLLIGRPSLLLLDEPYSNLDMIVKKVMTDVIDDVSKKMGITCILVSHHPEDTLPWADHILVMRSGRIVAKGNPQKILRAKSAYVSGLFRGYLLEKQKQMRRFKAS